MMLKRLFAKLYNEKKPRPLKIPERLKYNLRNSASVQIALRNTMKEFRSHLPYLSLAEIAKASREHIKAYYETPNLLSPTSPTIEPILRRHFFEDIMNPFVEQQKKYLQDQIFNLDKSLESRRNVLLVEEIKKVEKTLIEHKEKKRIEALKNINVQGPVDKSQVDGVLDGEINTQLVPFDTHTVVSFKGVVKMNSLPGKRPTFNDLTNQEIANYICYNLLSTEEALQMYTNSLENQNFATNNRAQMIQKIALFKEVDVQDKRLKELIKSLNLAEISKKNLCNTIWAIGKIYKKLPNSLLKVFPNFLAKFEEFIPICNSMNLAYASDGLRKLSYFDPDISAQILNRFIDLLEQIEIPEKPNSPTVPYANEPIKGHSVFYGSKDLTIPTTKVPVLAMFKVLKYLKKQGNIEAMPYLYKKCAKIIANVSLFELDKNLLNEGIMIFGELNEGLLFDSDIKECITKMSQLVMQYYDELTPVEICRISGALMGIRAFAYTSWFKLLELKAFELIDFTEDKNLILEITEKFLRYHIAVNYGRDIKIEPMIYIAETFKIENPLLNKVYNYLKTHEVEKEIRFKFAILLGLVGYSVNFPIELSAHSIIAAAIQNVNHFALEKIEFDDLVKIVSELNDYYDVAMLAAAFFKYETKLDWKYFESFYKNNKHLICEQPHRITFAWVLGQFEGLSYEHNLLTVSEKEMINEIKSLNI